MAIIIVMRGGCLRSSSWRLDLSGSQLGCVDFPWGIGSHRIYVAKEEIRSHTSIAVFDASLCVTCCSVRRRLDGFGESYSRKGVDINNRKTRDLPSVSSCHSRDDGAHSRKTLLIY